MELPAQRQAFPSGVDPDFGGDSGTTRTWPGQTPAGKAAAAMLAIDRQLEKARENTRAAEPPLRFGNSKLLVEE